MQKTLSLCQKSDLGKKEKPCPESGNMTEKSRNDKDLMKQQLSIERLL
jgi:hypothetical protein